MQLWVSLFVSLTVSRRVWTSLADSERGASLGESGWVWASLGASHSESGRIWASLDEFGRVWVCLGESGHVGQVWARLWRVWSSLVVWAGLDQSGRVGCVWYACQA